MKVLTRDKTIKRGSYTYNLMGDYIHINNHKANDKSIIVPVDAIKELLGVITSGSAHIDTAEWSIQDCLINNADKEGK